MQHNNDNPTTLEPRASEAANVLLLQKMATLEAKVDQVLQRSNQDSIKGVEEFDIEDQPIVRRPSVTDVFKCFDEPVAPPVVTSPKAPELPVPPTLQQEEAKHVEAEAKVDDHHVSYELEEDDESATPAPSQPAATEGGPAWAGAAAALAIIGGLALAQRRSNHARAAEVVGVTTLVSLGAFAIGAHIGARARAHSASSSASSSSSAAPLPLLAEGAPKVVSHVGKAKDLLIKKIARETAALQRDLDANSATNGGARLVNMSQGVPCLPIFEAAHKAMTALLDKRQLPYSDVAGEPDVRESAAAFVNAAYRQTGAKAFTKDNVIITAGAIQAIYNCLALSIEGPLDVVATPLPAYSIYQQQTGMLRGTFTTFGDSNLRVPTPDSLRELFSATNGQPDSNQKLRVLVLCLPNNPTGAMLTADEAQELCATLDCLWEEWYAKDPAGGFSIVLDEVYVGITAKPAPSASLLTFASDRLRNAIFLVSSCSKGLGAMPGARAAWITAPNAAVIPELSKIQLVCTGNASTLSQAGLKGSLDFLRTNPGQMDEVWRYYQVRTSLVVRRLKEIATKFGLSAIATESEATFYVWCDFGSLPRVTGKSETDLDFVAFLKSLHSDGTTGRVGLAAVPGSAFEVASTDLRLRLSCAREELSDLETAMGVVERAVAIVCEEGRA